MIHDYYPRQDDGQSLSSTPCYYLRNPWSFCRSIIIIDTLIIIWGALDLFADPFQSRIRESSSRQMTQCNSSVKQKVLKSFWILFIFVFVAGFYLSLYLLLSFGLANDSLLSWVNRKVLLCNVHFMSLVWKTHICLWYFIIANLCLFLFSNFRKGRLLYIRPVGRLVGWLTSPLICSIYTGIRALY